MPPNIVIFSIILVKLEMLQDSWNDLQFGTEEVYYIGLTMQLMLKNLKLNHKVFKKIEKISTSYLSKMQIAKYKSHLGYVLRYQIVATNTLKKREKLNILKKA